MIAKYSNVPINSNWANRFPEGQRVTFISPAGDYYFYRFGNEIYFPGMYKFNVADTPEALIEYLNSPAAGLLITDDYNTLDYVTEYDYDKLVNKAYVKNDMNWLKK